uniref:MULE transposase domain-containing protein n=1 Tax=Aegilops tauschii subsp. strangulata TaxID=200361 RepID=A0A453EVK2_AEGTS
MTSQSWVADKAATMLKKDPTIGAVKILKELQEEHHVTLDYHTVWKGKQKAATSLYGSWEESFRMLYNYKAEIELRSPRSIVEIDTTTSEGEVHFSKLFIPFKPCIDGFLNGCRPYISIDSTHLNGKWKGQLAVVTALDGHNWMFPVAYGFIESENEDNWAWFMNQVKKAIGDPPVLAVCTDACKGLENAVKKVFPQAEQRECFRHMWHNFQKYFHGDVFGRLWPAARASSSRLKEALASGARWIRHRRPLSGGLREVDVVQMSGWVAEKDGDAGCGGCGADEWMGGGEGWRCWLWWSGGTGGADGWVARRHAGLAAA